MSSVSADQPSAKTTEEAARMKLLCSHGGKILPRADGQLRYVGGDTRLVSVKKSVGFAELRNKLEKIFGSNLLLKYQLPNEDLDALVSVTCDEDMDNLKEEYDRNEVRDGASRLRAFLFPLSGASSRSVISSVDQVGDEARSSPEHLQGTRSQPNAGFDSSSMAFQLPDYLFGLDTACHSASHVPVQQERDLSSSRHLQTLVNGGGSSVTSALPSKEPPLKADSAARQQSSNINLDSPGVPQSSSNYHHSRETKKLLDMETPGSRREERPAIELNVETGYKISQRDAVTELAMNQIAPNDKIVHTYTEVSHADSHSMIGKLQPLQHFELLNLEDVYTDVPGVSSDSRLDALPQVSCRPTNPPEGERCMPQSTSGVTVFDVQWGLRQPKVSGFDVAPEKPGDSGRGSGDSNESMHQRTELQAAVESAVQPRPVTTTTAGVADTFRYKDENGPYQMSPLHAQIDLSQHFYQVGKGNFPQIYRQLQDSQEWQQHQMYEQVQIAHGAPEWQRLVQPLTSNVPSGAAVHLHMPSTQSQSNAREVLRSDAVPNARFSSPLHRQVASASALQPDSQKLASACALQPDSQKLSRARSPSREHPAGRDSLMSSIYGHHLVQLHEMGYLATSITHQSSGIPVPQAYMNPVEARLYDQSGSQSHYVEKGAIVNRETIIGQVQYTDKVILANHDAAATTVHYPDNNLQTSQYMWMSNNQDIQGASLPKDNLGLRSDQ